jgi:hypothetical protein
MDAGGGATQEQLPKHTELHGINVAWMEPAESGHRFYFHTSLLLYSYTPILS